MLENGLKSDTAAVLSELNVRARSRARPMGTDKTGPACAQAAGIRCVMLTGDNVRTAVTVAMDAGLVQPGVSRA